MIVELSEQEWQQLLFVLGNAEGKGINWSLTNPLLMKIGQQLQAQATASVVKPPHEIRLNADGGKEEGHG